MNPDDSPAPTIPAEELALVTLAEGLNFPIDLAVVDRDDPIGTGAGSVLAADDDVQAQRSGMEHGLLVRNAAIDGNDQLGPFLFQSIQGLRMEAVALPRSVRDIKGCIRPQFSKEEEKERDGRDSVHVVIAVDDDLFPTGQGAQNPLHRSVHVFQVRGAKLGETGIDEDGCLPCVLDTPIKKELSDGGKEAQLTGKVCPGGGVLRKGSPIALWRLPAAAHPLSSSNSLLR
jgi:hypothetical protein